MTATEPTIRHFRPEQQGSGAFDGGKITEIKPIPFPHERGGSRAKGPLFYWAWATAHGDGTIPMHPHQGFEILSYALEGEIGHSDTLGTKSRVGKGGVQIMQTGSGVSHQEEMFGERTDFFQIWFEPNLREAITREPTYADFSDADFPREEIAEGVETKKIIGNGGPIDLVADAAMSELSFAPEVSVNLKMGSGNFLAIVAMSGSGHLTDSQPIAINARDFSIVSGIESVEIKAGAEGLKLFVIEAPEEVDYPLYSNRG